MADRQRLWRAARRGATPLVLALWALAVAAHTRQLARLEVAWPDECIYLVGARKLVERRSLQTNFYLTHSILARGHPHRDVHMPGYVLALAPFVAWRGPTLDAAAVLNVTAFVGCILLVFVLARALLESEPQAIAAAALTALLPPLPGYLFVAYPELIISFVFLAGLAWAVRGRGSAHAALAGVLYGMGALFRENLLLGLPLYLVRLRRREALRAFLPAAAATLLGLLPLAFGRAIHPNALYPSLIEEARRSARPLSVLLSTLASNVSRNVALARQADPRANAEDAVLVFFLLLAIAAAAALPFLPRGARGFALASLGSAAVLTVTMFVLYVVRERGGVWGGVRACLPWAPLLLILAMPLLFRPRRWLVAALLLLTAGGFVWLDLRQIRFFNHYKDTDLEDQDRMERYISRYVAASRPQRIVARNFLYGLRHYPAEVVWSLPQDGRELQALERALPYDFLVIHERDSLRLALIRNPRYLRVNGDDRAAEFLVWRRLY